jgi:hypothetical protein
LKPVSRPNPDVQALQLLWKSLLDDPEPIKLSLNIAVDP